MKTTWKTQSEIERDWYHVDVTGQILGRVATRIAELLIGKSKADRVPNMDCGDYVVVTNASKIEVTGRKMEDKMYRRHSGYAGGFKELTLAQVMADDPRKVIISAVKNMLPNTKLRDSMIIRLKVFPGSEHEHEAQKPQKVELKS